MARDTTTAGDPAVACTARAPMAATHRAGPPVARAFMARRSLAHVPVADAGRTPAGLARDRLRETGPAWAGGLLRVTAAVPGLPLRCARLDTRRPYQDSPVVISVLRSRLACEGNRIASSQATVPVHHDAGEMRPASSGRIR